MGKRWLWMVPVLLLGASEGETIYNKAGCYGCHGLKGEGIGDYPKIGGKSQAYLVKKLHDLQKGIGYTSKRDLMIPFARGLNDVQIEAVSRYLSTIDAQSEEEEVPEDILGGFGS